MKKFFVYILCLAPWFLSSFLKADYDYLTTINTPFFTPPSWFYIVSWSLIYILVSYSFYRIITSYSFKNIPKSYKVTYLLNYLANQSFIPLFFILKNNFLGFISCLITLLTILFLYSETKPLNKTAAKVLIPYILLAIFATILSLSIFLIN